MNPPVASPTGGYHPSDPSPYFTQPNYHHSPSPPPQQPDRSYTLGGDSYGASAIPDYQNPSGYDASYYAHYAPPTSTPSPAPINTHVSPPPEPVATSPRGPRAPQNPVYDDSPPVYDVATAQPPGQWGAKR